MLTLAIVAFSIGCTPEAKIVRHTIPKDRSGLEKLREPKSLSPSTNSQLATAQETRMAVAIFENPDATWFFKVNGPAEQVSETEDQWRAFFQSVRFNGAEPSWDKPEDWSIAGPKPMRHTTLIIGKTQPPLEVAISSLGPGQDLLLNINRWRGQVGLGPSKSEELDGQIQKLESEGGKYLVFDAVGTGSGQMRPPFAGGAAPFANRKPVSPAVFGEAESMSAKLVYETPDGWSTGKTSAMVPGIRLIKEGESGEVQITVIEMIADINEWDPNVKRWAEQVGMGSLTADELAEHVSDITVDGVPGKSVDLVDPTTDSPTGTIAGMVKRDGSAWFLKLSGDKKLVEENRETFKKFLDSIRFN